MVDGLDKSQVIGTQWREFPSAGVVRLISIRVRLSVLTCFAFAAFGQDAPADAVQKMFANSCTSCHGGAKPAGKLDLTSLTAMSKGGASGPAVVPRNAENSPLLQRIASHGAQVLRTDRLGTIVARTDGQRIYIEAAGDRWELPRRSEP